MKIPTRREEQILMAVHNLQEDAYLVSITDYLAEVTGKNLALPSVHGPLDRLQRLGMLESKFSEATAVRGGRRKKIYRITKSGYEILNSFHRLSNQLWQIYAETVGNRKEGGQ